MPAQVADYAVIGDLRSAALIDRSGTIAWWCPSRFDAPAVFAALLGDDRAGSWLLAPRGAHQAERRYHEDTMLLVTGFARPSGTVEVTDFMPIAAPHPTIVRVVRGIAGTVEMTTRVRARMQYGELAPLTTLRDGIWEARAGPDGLALHADVAIHDEDGDAVAAFTVHRGDLVTFSLQRFPAHAAPSLGGVAYDVEATVRWWQQWSAAITYEGPWRNAVVRSALTLNALRYGPSGGFVAAATTSLPERLGGERNWDYRYCWLRDGAFTTTALLNVGMRAEAAAWCDWFLRAYAGDVGSLRIMYGVEGERLPPERTLPWLTGFRNSRPVRVANDAHEQFQLGVFGDVTRALVAASRVRAWIVDDDRWEALRPILGYLERVWDRPDNGIWETRGEKHRYVHSALMAWRAAANLALLAPDWADADRDRARALADRVRHDLETHGYEPRRRAFTEYYGSRSLDASVLLMPLQDFLPVDDVRVEDTVRAIEHDLMVDGYLFRYSPDLRMADGRLEEQEGSFTMCGFWLVQVWLRQGRVDRARELFERLLGTANDVGLLSEEYDVRAHEAVGNTPQAFSHCGVIDAAVAFARAEVERAPT